MLNVFPPPISPSKLRARKLFTILHYFKGMTKDFRGQTHLNCSCGIVPVVRPVLPEPARANCFDPGHAQGAISPLVASSSLEKRPYFRAGHHNMKLDAFALKDFRGNIE
jgi:hypothetical protein